jgi:hypothetical protein
MLLPELRRLVEQQPIRPLLPLNVTAIMSISNGTPFDITVWNREHPGDTNDDDGFTIITGQTAAPNPPVGVWIPWCDTEQDFRDNHYIEVAVGATGGRVYIWQHRDAVDGDFVRFSHNVGFESPGTIVLGASSPGGTRNLEFDSPDPPPVDPDPRLNYT